MISTDDLIFGYQNGIFPMADGISNEIYWYAPDPRAIIPLENYKPAKSLKPFLNQKKFDVKVNYNFEATIRFCAEARFVGDETWISEEIIKVYKELNCMGLAHSVEAYQNNVLVGGLYGVAMGAVFFGESMFHKVSNASKVAFHYLIEILKKQNFLLLDTQFINDNVLRFGATEISKKEFLLKLKYALGQKRNFLEEELDHLFVSNRRT
jgi:leucyl/phenylalanyl-tRNA--protein transferase